MLIQMTKNNVETSEASESFWVVDFKNTINMRSYEV